MPGTSPPAAVFRCTVCGECCRGDQKVWLNPADLERLAAELALSGPAELESRRIVVSEPSQHGVMRPRLRFRPSPAGLQCPFLVNDLDEDGRLWGKCSLHNTAAKPLVCRLAPLARTVDLEAGTEEWREVPPVIGCPGWPEGEEPPAEGRPLESGSPALPAGLRADLDIETRYFRELASSAGGGEHSGSS